MMKFRSIIYGLLLALAIVAVILWTREGGGVFIYNTF